MTALEQIGGIIRPCKYLRWNFMKKNSTVNLNTLTILAKSSIWIAWVGRECASAGGYTIAFKIQAKIFFRQQVMVESFWRFRSMKWPLKQLSKVIARCRSEEYLFGNFSANYYQSICGIVYVYQNSMFSAYSSEHL